MIETITLGDLYAQRPPSVNPARHQHEEFDLFSVPAYESGVPSRVRGIDIGSSKIAVQPGDVLLCRIVPHIRRAWVVPEGNGRRQIASGEWMVMRDDRAFPAYLRYLLLSDNFHRQFMATVAGVGGSLMRARPRHAAAIEIPLPLLPEQRRIASILDELDAIRRKRRHAIAVSAEAEDAALHKLLSDGPDARRVAVREIAEIQTGPFGSLLHKSDYIEGGIPLVNPTHIRDGRVVPDPEFSVTEATYSALKNYSLHPGDVVLGRRGEMGRSASITSAHGRLLCGTGSLIVRPRDGAVLGTVLAGMLSSPLARRKLEQTAQGVTMLNLNQSIVGSLELNVPSMQSQVDFDEFRDALVASREYHQRHLAKLDELFVSVQHRAFRADSVSR